MEEEEFHSPFTIEMKVEMLVFKLNNPNFSSSSCLGSGRERMTEKSGERVEILLVLGRERENHEIEGEKRSVSGFLSV